jgi:hypothetical protein
MSDPTPFRTATPLQTLGKLFAGPTDKPLAIPRRDRPWAFPGAVSLEASAKTDAGL